MVARQISGDEACTGIRPGLNSAAYSWITDWFALNSNELTWIALITVGVIAAGMLM